MAGCFASYGTEHVCVQLDALVFFVSFLLAVRVRVSVGCTCAFDSVGAGGGCGAESGRIDNSDLQIALSASLNSCAKVRRIFFKVSKGVRKTSPIFFKDEILPRNYSLGNYPSLFLNLLNLLVAIIMRSLCRDDPDPLWACLGSVTGAAPWGLWRTGCNNLLRPPHTPHPQH